MLRIIILFAAYPDPVVLQAMPCTGTVSLQYCSRVNKFNQRVREGITNKEKKIDNNIFGSLSLRFWAGGGIFQRRSTFFLDDFGGRRHLPEEMRNFTVLPFFQLFNFFNSICQVSLIRVLLLYFSD